MSNLPFVGISAQEGVLMEEHYSAIREARVRISVCKDVLKGGFVCFIVFAVALE